MSVRLAPTWSIRWRVMAWLFVAMALVFSANLLSSYYSNIEAADVTIRTVRGVGYILE